MGRAVKTRTIDSNGDVIVESKYDNMGRVTDVSNPYREGTNASEILWSKTTYDEAGRVETVYSPAVDGQTGDSLGTNEYGIVNNVNGITGVWQVSEDASGRKSRSITNSLGQLARIDEATSFGGSITQDLGSLTTPHQATTYKYNIKGEMVEVTQGSQKRNFLYDSLGRLIRVKQPEQEVNTAFNKTDPVTGNNTWTAKFEYDVIGNLVKKIDAKGTEISNTYDNADRVLTRTYSDGTPTVTYKYDLIPNGKGALIETSNAISTSKTTKIDQWGRPTEYQQITDGVTYTSSYEYNLSGALVAETYPSGRVVKTDFDANGDVSRIWGTNGTANQVFANAFNYTASGGIASMRLGNGKWETAKFNARLQVDELGLGNSASDASTWKVNYDFGEYDPNTGTVTGSKNTGNIARQTISFGGLAQPFVQTYQYDALYRLKEANEMAGSSENWKQNFTYDRYGNRLTHDKFINGNQVTQTVQSHPNISSTTNRFTNSEYGYDKVGNLTTDAEGRSFVFDGNNKQILVTNVNSQSVGDYFYDGDGKRVKKKVYTGGVHSETVIFVYSGGKLVEEFSTAPSQSPKTKYMTEDHLGTPRIITDGIGQVVSRRDFMPFGEDLGSTVGTRSTTSFKYSTTDDDVRQKFTGYQQDKETGLDFAEARMYENRHARFTAVDPLLVSGKSANPQTFNRYVYVGNNPMNITDPLGLDWYYNESKNFWQWFDSEPEKGNWKRLNGYMPNSVFTCLCPESGVVGSGNNIYVAFDPLSNKVFKGEDGKGFASQKDAENFINSRKNILRVRDFSAAITNLTNPLGLLAVEMGLGTDISNESSPDYIASELIGNVASTAAGGPALVKGAKNAVGGFAAAKTLPAVVPKTLSKTGKAKKAIRTLLSESKAVVDKATGQVRLEAVKDGVKYTFRKDFGKNAHPIGRKYPNPVDHYNIDISLPGRIKGRFRLTETLHIVIDKAGKVVEVF